MFFFHEEYGYLLKKIALKVRIVVYLTGRVIVLLCI